MLGLLLAVTAAAGLWHPATSPGPSPIVTSLDTIPTGYFGGSGGTGGKSRSRRTDAEIAALAQQRVVVIEKWEGPCWDECLSNSSHTPPIACSSSCSEEAYQLDTIRRIKAVNPNVSTVFYLNSMYDFPYYNLTAAFAAADLHVRDVNGQVVGMQNDNGMLHIPIFDFSKPLAVTMFIDFHRRLIASGLVDGTFADKPNERAFQKNGSWYICENPNGPPPRHSWAQACGEISAATAAAYNAGKEKMLNQLVQLYGKKGALWPVCSDGVEQCGSVCSRHAPCTLNLGSSTHEEKHAQLVQILQNYSYVYFMQGDSHGTGMVCGCSAADIIHFLLIIEEGMVIGCNGRDDSTKHAVPPQSWWSSKLGQPVGPPQTVGHRVIRSFASGVRVWYDLVAKSGSIDGWEPLPSTNREDDDAWVARNLGVEQEK